VEGLEASHPGLELLPGGGTALALPGEPGQIRKLEDAFDVMDRDLPVPMGDPVRPERGDLGELPLPGAMRRILPSGELEVASQGDGQDEHEGRGAETMQSGGHRPTGLSGLLLAGPDSRTEFQDQAGTQQGPAQGGRRRHG